MAAIWHRRELPSTGQMAGFLKLGSNAAKGLRAGELRAPHGRRTTLRPALRGEEPAAREPGPGVGGVTGTGLCDRLMKARSCPQRRASLRCRDLETLSVP